MSNHPFLALDLETTGLDRERDQVLQIGAVAYGDGDPAEFSTIIRHERVSGHPHAMVMNAELLGCIANGEGMTPVAAWRAFTSFIYAHTALEFYLVGFNVGSFDRILATRDLESYGFSTLERAHHRCVELGSLYAKIGGTPAGSRELCERLLGRDLKHDALQDARDAMLLHLAWIRGEDRWDSIPESSPGEPTLG